jgi:hypothetical protein
MIGSRRIAAWQRRSLLFARRRQHEIGQFGPPAGSATENRPKEQDCASHSMDSWQVSWRRKDLVAEKNRMSNWVSENLSQGIHFYSGGEGSTIVLVPGWPETAEAYSELFPLLALSAFDNSRPFDRAVRGSSVGWDCVSTMNSKPHCSS